MIVLAVSSLRHPLLSTRISGPDQYILHLEARLKPISAFQTGRSQAAPSSPDVALPLKSRNKAVCGGYFSSALALLQHWQNE
jgi:hypothetical protein